MNVLIMHPKVPIFGGAELVIVKLCQYMAENSIPHALAMPHIPGDMKDKLVGTPVISSVPDIIANLNLFDVVNFYNFPATLFSMICNKPMCWYMNEPPELFTSWKRKFIEWGNRNLARTRIGNIIVADKFNARRCFDIYNIVPTVIPYGIDYDYFSRVDYRPNPGYFTVIQVGTISRYKNQSATIEAVASVIDQIPNIRLWLIGNVSEPDYKEELQKQIQDLKLGGIVEWQPHVTREHLRYLYSMSDVLLHPVKEQGGWLTPFEAMSAGVPVITSKSLTCSDMIETNRLGLVSSDYAHSLLAVYNSRGINPTVNHAHDWVRDNLTWSKFGESMVSYYESLLSARR